MPQYQLKYWATLFREIEFTADNIDDAWAKAEEFPIRELENQKETNGIEERSEIEVEPIEG